MVSFLRRMRCVEENELVKFAEGRLPAPAAAELERHLDECGTCRAAVAAVLRSTDDDAARAQPADGERPTPGSTVGRYVVLQLLGKGGMGQVFAAYDPQLDRKVALKFVRAGVKAEHAPALRARLLREAQAMARLSHPNVVAVFDAGAYEDDVFIAMEFVSGTTARRWAQAHTHWRQVIDVYLQAGRGLAAAHAAGLVHRDFKPENVLVGVDGTARVTDFGLVKRTPVEGQLRNREENLPVADPSRALDETLTQVGAYMGTVGYMAPEVLRGEPADARSDQFSFCAALYEALHGQGPFGGKGFAGYREAVLAGNVQPPPPGSRVPPRIRKALVRGLSNQPSERFPSLDLLLDELSRRNRTALVTGIAASAAAALIAAGYAWSLPSLAERCAAEASVISRVWSPEARETLRRAFERSGQLQARDAWVGAERTLEDWTREWSATRAATCTSAAKGVPAQLITRHQVCLDEAREELDALLRLFQRPDARTVATAITATYALPRPRQCVDAKRLAEQGTPGGTIQLAGVRALRYSGHHVQALEEAEALAATARSAGDRILLAEALFEVGALRDFTGKFEDAVAAFEEADLLADALGFDWLRARVAVEMVYTHYMRKDSPAGSRWAERAGARLERLGGDDGLRSKLLRYQGELLVQQGRREEGVALQREGLRLARETYGEGEPVVLVTMIELANTLDAMGEFDEALPLAERGYEGRVLLYGAESPQANFARIVLAYILLDLGEYDRALELSKLSLGSSERQYGPDHFRVAEGASNLATALLASGQVAEARALYGRANRLYSRAYGTSSYYFASSLTDVARAEWAMGQARAAEKLAREAMTIIERSKMDAEAKREAVREPLLLLADLALEERRPREALALYQRALEAEEHHGPRNVRTAVALTGMGEASLALGELDDAIALLERAVSVREGKRVPREDAGRTRFALAQALWAKGTELERARRLAGEAREAYAAGAKRERHNVARINGWLGARSG